MKKRYLSLMIALCIVIVISGLALAEYNPLPGVMSPDEVDLNGKTINFVGAVYRTGMPDKFKEGEVAEGRIEKAEELFNCKINWVGLSYDSHDQIPERFASRVLTGESDYELWNMNFLRFPLVVSRGLLKPTDNFLSEEYYKNVTDVVKGTLETFRYKGNDFLLSQENNFSANLGIMLYNKTVINELGLEDPGELYKNNEWTWDKMIEIAEGATQDTDGDGEINQWGLVLSDWNFIFGGMLYSNDAQVVREEDGKYIFSMGDRKMIDTLKLIPQLVERNVVTPLEWGTYFEKLISGSVVMVPMRLNNAANRNLLKEEHINLVPLPKGPNAEDNLFYSSSGGGMFLPVNAKEPEKLIALHSYLYRKEDNQAIDMQIGEIVDTQDKFQIIMESLEDNDRIRQIFGKTGDALRYVISDVITEVFEGRAPEVAVDEVKQQAQTILDDIFNDEN